MVDICQRARRVFFLAVAAKHGNFSEVNANFHTQTAYFRALWYINSRSHIFSQFKVTGYESHGGATCKVTARQADAIIASNKRNRYNGIVYHLHVAIKQRHSLFISSHFTSAMNYTELPACSQLLTWNDLPRESFFALFSRLVPPSGTVHLTGNDVAWQVEKGTVAGRLATGDSY